MSGDPAPAPPGTRTVRSLLDVREADWDAVAAAGPLQQSYGYLRTVESAPGIDVRYVLATGPDGSVLGALPVYLPASVTGPHPPSSTLLAHLPLGDQRPPGWEAAVYAGVAHGYCNAVLIRPSVPLSQRAGVLAVLLDGARAERDRAAAGTVLHRHLVDGQQNALGRGTALIEDAEAVLDLPGDGWDDYVAALGKRRRYDVRRELTTFSCSGLSLSRGRLGDVWESAAALSAQVFARYGRPGAEPQRHARYRRIIEHWSADLEVVLLRRGTRLVGFSSVVAWGTDLYVLDYGLDYADAGDFGEYFHLVFYEPIRIAYERGLRRVQLGRGTLRAKTLRGARAQPLWTVADGLEPPPGVAEKWNADTSARLGLALPVTAS